MQRVDVDDSDDLVRHLTAADLAELDALFQSDNHIDTDSDARTLYCTADGLRRGVDPHLHDALFADDLPLGAMARPASTRSPSSADSDLPLGSDTSDTVGETDTDEADMDVDEIDERNAVLTFALAHPVPPHQVLA